MASFPRILTAAMTARPFFTDREVTDDEGGYVGAVSVPDDWDVTATRLFAAEALRPSVPYATSAIEENTLPSWLWARRAFGNDRRAEDSATDVFARIAGSACYAAWKLGAFTHEGDAAAFYDDLTHMLTGRFAALEPSALRTLGTGWAYGETALASAQRTSLTPTPASVTSIGNAAMDAMAGGIGRASPWKASSPQSVLFTDTAREWNDEQADTVAAPRLMLDLLRFVREDGTVNVAALIHTVRLSVWLLELHYDALGNAAAPRRPLAIGFANLATALMAKGLAYDSDAGRATAAALIALIEASCVQTSAEIAALTGACAAFGAERTAALRALGNRRRAAWGERSDYDRLSVLPAPLSLAKGADLAVIAEARRVWDDALERAQRHGLRHMQGVVAWASPAMAAWLTTSCQGVETETSLFRDTEYPDGTFTRAAHPIVPRALMAAGADDATIQKTVASLLAYDPALDAPLAALLATGETVPAEAKLAMAAALQPFVHGDMGVVLSVPHGAVSATRAVLLTAWRHGLSGLHVEVAPEETAASAARSSRRRVKRLSARKPAMPSPDTAPHGFHTTSAAMRATPRNAAAKPKATQQVVSARTPTAAPARRNKI